MTTDPRSPQLSAVQPVNPLRRIAIASLSTALMACGVDHERDPRSFPDMFEVDFAQNGPIKAIDLDNDGRDELVNYYQRRLDGVAQRGHGIVLIYTQSHVNIEQLNYAGQVLEPRFLDLDDDQRPEIFVPILRNDSLFVSVASGRGEKLFHFFLLSGTPRSEPEGDLPWDPNVVDFHLVDTDEDGTPELVTVLSTWYARLPRGVLVHRFSDGHLVGQRIIGALISQSLLGDFDEDGRPELVVCSFAANNGADAGGFDDSHSYVIMFEFTPAPEIAWATETGGIFHYAYLAQADFDADGRGELLVATTATGPTSEDRARFEIVDPGTWRVQRRYSSAEPLGRPIILDLDRDASPEVIVSRHPDELWVLDEYLERVKKASFTNMNTYWPRWYVPALPDLDGDGVEEIAIRLADGFAILGPDLKVKARHPSGVTTGILHRGVGLRPAVIARASGTWTVLNYVDNPLFWLYRYGRPVLVILGVAGSLLAGLWLARARRRQRLLQALHEQALERGATGIMLIDSDGRVRWSNQAFKDMLALEDEGRSPASDLEAVAAGAPKLAEFCRNALAGVPKERTGHVSLPVGDQRLPAKLVAQPLIARLRGDPHWLVRITDGRTPTDADDSRIWAMMAQRVAHGLKNPLTGILLTLQRLQIEYRERAPAVATRLDRFSTRIEGRIEQLRQMTNNFLKFVDLEDPDLEETDLNVLVRDFGEPCRRSLPPDIRLRLKLDPNLPAVRVDREQVHSLLDNLVTNAMNAMPEGGVITVATKFAEAVRFPDNPLPSDYVQLEVLDTGKGIPPDILDRLFEPGFANEQGGSGLGLAIVKKIVSDHSGEITVESELGTGSAFSVYLPANREAIQSGSALS